MQDATAGYVAFAWGVVLWESNASTFLVRGVGERRELQYDSPGLAAGAFPFSDGIMESVGGFLALALPRGGVIALEAKCSKRNSLVLYDGLPEGPFPRGKSTLPIVDIGRMPTSG